MDDPILRGAPHREIGRTVLVQRGQVLQPVRYFLEIVAVNGDRGAGDSMAIAARPLPPSAANVSRKVARKDGCGQAIGQSRAEANAIKRVGHMNTASTATLAIVTSLSVGLAAASAHAACRDSDRPPTPDAVRGEARSPTTIRISFRATAITYDISARQGSPSGRLIGNKTGVSPTRFPPDRYGFDYFGLNPGAKYFFQILARKGEGAGGCVSKVAAEVYVDTPPDTHVSAACRTYAQAAVDAANSARNVYKCDSKLISGPRWSANLDEHQKWCMAVPSASRQAEAEARAKTLRECRLEKRANVPTMLVRWQRGNVFHVRGSGFSINARVNIDVSGSPTTPKTITVVDGRPLATNALGIFDRKLTGICNTLLSRGTVAFTARDQEGRQAKTVTAECKSDVEYVPKPKTKF